MAGFSYIWGMPINPLRPSPNFNLSVLGNGSVLDDTRLNQFQAAMNAFAGRGAMVAELCGASVNGRIQVPLGAVSKGFANSFRLDKKSIAIPLWVPAGYDSLTIMFACQLNLMKNVVGVTGGFVGSIFRVEIVQGGQGRTVQEISWRSPMLDPLGNGYFEFNVPLANIFNLSPIHADLIYIRLHYSMTEGYDILLGQNTTGTHTTADFWNGCGYFGAAVYKSTDVC